MEPGQNGRLGHNVTWTATVTGGGHVTILHRPMEVRSVPEVIWRWPSAPMRTANQVMLIMIMIMILLLLLLMMMMMMMMMMNDDDDDYDDGGGCGDGDNDANGEDDDDDDENDDGDADGYGDGDDDDDALHLKILTVRCHASDINQDFERPSRNVWSWLRECHFVTSLYPDIIIQYSYAQVISAIFFFLLIILLILLLLLLL